MHVYYFTRKWPCQMSFLYQLKSTNSSGALTLCQTLNEVQCLHWLLSLLSLGLIILFYSFSPTWDSCYKRGRNEEFSLFSLNLVPWYMCTCRTLKFPSARLSFYEFLVFYVGCLLLGPLPTSSLIPCTDHPSLCGFWKGSHFPSVPSSLGLPFG